MSALVYGGDGKGAACTGRGLLEDERDVFALEEVALDPGAFFVLEVRREVKQIVDLFRGMVLERNKMAVAKIHRHR